MSPPTLDSVEITNKKIILRADLDVKRNADKILETDRLDKLIPTIKKILEKNPAKLMIIGHAGRPKGREENLSLRPLVNYFSDKLNQQIGFLDSVASGVSESSGVILLENLRFDRGEEENSLEFAKSLASLADVYINDAFGNSHREHASMVSLPRLLPHSAGLHLLEEVSHLAKARNDPARPLIILISGAKKDKLSYIDDFKSFADKILISGLLPTFLPENIKDDKLLIGKLIQDRQDITINSIQNFETEISKAKTIVLAGPTGKYEEEGHSLGTKRVFESIASSNANKIAGGGDTVAAINLFSLQNSFDWISTGGGAMLEFLAKGTLPGIEALTV